uniref:Transmembrane protein 1 n=1 Tax=Alternaria brassicicola TaxID=29001 RepID=B6RIT9_ALTBR|nr:transmembrane protein 1 [Alternaria brassicicola]
MKTHTSLENVSGPSYEDQSLVSRFGRGPVLSVPHDTVHEAFESIVDTFPGIVAAIHGANSITYLQLDLAANRLAHYLIASGLRPRQRVCVVVQRSIEMLIGFFAIMKAGCQYVPIDGGVASDEALRHIFDDTAARFILCLPRYWDRAKRFANNDAIVLELGMDTGAFYSPLRPGIQVTSSDGVYAMYTSGTSLIRTTGVPKGVDVKHGTKTNALLSEPGRLRMTVGSKVGQVLSISFAMGAWEMLGCLMNGGTLYLRGSDWDVTLKQIDTLICTPSILSKYKQQHYPNIKTVAVAGEACPQSLADDWAQQRSFWNLLGSTETFLLSAQEHVVGKPLSIGRPLPNTSCYVLDHAGRLARVGQKGTLWVGGAGVAKGYINLPLTNAKKFHPDKFANDSSKMYDFGNIACWRSDGTLDSFGRMDDQVKIKGFRVELDGVIAVTERFHGITRAASLVMDGILHGFYASSAYINEKELDDFVRKQLPYYSVPERWLRVDDIPLNLNGKVDKAQLKILAAERNNPVVHVKRLETMHTRSESAFDPLALFTKAMVPRELMRALADVDLEKAYPLKSLEDYSLVEKDAPLNIPARLPEPDVSEVTAWLRHRGLIAYRWFLFPIVFANAGVACWLLYRYMQGSKYPLSPTATATASNLCAAILIRSEPVINLLFLVCSSVPTSTPLWIRRIFAKVFHIGGIHVGCAIAAVMWFVIFTVGASLEMARNDDERERSVLPAALSYLTLLLLIAMTSLSHPVFRNRHHDLWEALHRFGGWTVLILYWVLVGLSTKDLAHGRTLSTSEAYLQTPSLWLITAATCAIIFPWLFLRRVPVRPEVLSSHAVRLHFDSEVTPGKGVRLAQHPLRDWHGFATITNAPGGKGHSVIVSRAGDFTGNMIDTAPTHIWRRGIPTSGVLRIATLFKSVVVVATGSGIGPCLSIFPYRHVAMRVLWTAPNHETTFGKAIVDAVRRKDPRAVLYNTRTSGKPDMSLLAYRVYKESDAEAVLVISNKRFTQQIVFDMEKRGIPAYGAIFDS